MALWSICRLQRMQMAPTENTRWRPCAEYQKAYQATLDRHVGPLCKNSFVPPDAINTVPNPYLEPVCSSLHNEDKPRGITLIMTGGNVQL